MKARILLRFFLLVTVLFCTNSVSAQTDTTDFIIYDVVYLKSGGALYGEITSFDESTGGLVFKDKYGRSYSLGRGDYDYFIQDKVFPNKKKKKENKQIFERKDGEMGYFIGLSSGYNSLNNNLTIDDYYLNGLGTISNNIPTNIKFGIGRYFNRQNFVGITGEVPLISDLKNVNAGIRYQYQYDGNKKNTAFYVPFELHYSYMKPTFLFDVADTTFNNNGGWSYPSQLELNTTISALQFNFGQGFQFMLQNKKALNLELTFFKSFVISQKFELPEGTPNEPKTSISNAGFKLALMFHF